MIHIGFTGSREGITSLQETCLHALFASVKGDVTVHHGDCVGADEACHRIARLHRLTIAVHPPNLGGKRAFCVGDFEYPPMHYLDRNRAIVEASALLLACPNSPPKLHSGTWATVRYAMKAHVPARIIWPDGSITDEEGKPW